MSTDKQINVVVTGGNPYLSHDFNTSASVRDVLPKQLDRPGRPTINIVKYPEDVKCIYTWVMDMSKQIVSGDPVVFPGNAQNVEEPLKPDLILHLGMRTRYPGYCFETFARREGYSHPGEDGEQFPKTLLENGGAWEGLPSELHSGFNMEDLRQRVLQRIPQADIKVSDDAGLYFCEFQLLSTLAELRKQELPAKAAFLHVPQWQSEEAIQLGGEVAKELILAIFEED